MRALMFAALLGVAACSVETGRGGEFSDLETSGYTIEIRTSGAEHIYAVTGPDEKFAAARVAQNEATSLDRAGLEQAFAAMPAPEEGRATDQSVSMRAPGFSFHASGDEKDDGGDEDRAQVQMRFGGFSMDVQADEGGPGDEDDRARVRLTGLDADDARKFIQDQEDLNAEVKTEMLTALGLAS